MWKPGLGEVGERSLKQGALLSYSVVSDSLQPRGLQSARLLCPWDSPGKNTGVGCHALLQGIFPIQGSNPDLPHCRQISLLVELPGKPKNTGVLPFPSPGDLPHPVIKLGSPALQMDFFFFFSFHFLQMDSLPAELPGKPLDSDQICSQLNWTVHTALPPACCCSQETGQDEMPKFTLPPLWVA